MAKRMAQEGLCHDACRRRHKIAMIQYGCLVTRDALVDLLDYRRVPIICGDTLGEDAQYMPVALCRLIVEIGISRTWRRTSCHHVIFADVHTV